MKKLFIYIVLFIPGLLIAQTTIVKENYILNSGQTGHYSASQSVLIKPNSWIKSGSIFSATISLSFPKSTPVTSENYIYTIQPQVPLDVISVQTSANDLIEAITYFDGLGRPKQNIAIRAGGGAEDIITHITYDEYGRQKKEYLPYASAGNLGVYRGTAETETHSFYKTNYADDFFGILEIDINPFSEKEFEESPLNRVLKQAAPGEDWKLDNGHEIKFDYLSNGTNEVRMYTISLSSDYTPTLQSPTPYYYGLGELYKTITKDENWKTNDGPNRTTEEFKDKQGRVLLKRTYNNGQGHDTFYVYDDYGNLTYVLPPKSEATSTPPSATILSELCYQYKYDTRNRLVEKKIPGKGWEYMVYDKLDRPVLTQDANLRLQNQWLFTKYDVFGRVAYTGITRFEETREQVQTAYKVLTYTLHETRTITPSNYVGSQFYHTYTNLSFPFEHNQIELHTVNYYDDYDNFDHNAINPITVYGKPVDLNTKSLPTCSKVKVLGTNNWATTVTYYDDKARSIYVYSENEYLNTVDIVKRNLDFVGKIIEITSEHTLNSNATISTIDKFEYDHIARLKQLTQQVNSQSVELIAKNTYDELGQLETKAVGNLASNATRLQTVDYNYNVRGWLKGINNETGTNAAIGLGTDDLFGFQINYNDPITGTALYNGNISQTLWKTTSLNTTGNPVSAKYTYTYDALNRITTAIDNTTNYNVSGINYDKNGNIKNLTRQGLLYDTTFGNIDVLTYNYGSINGNKLLSVTDTGNSTVGFIDGNTSGDDFSYDVNGNLISDANKPAIGTIEYNHLNLPVFIPENNTNIGGISYVYDATGVKLEKAVTTQFGGGAFDRSATQYAGNYIYKSSSGSTGTPIYDPKTGTYTGGPYSNLPELQFFNHAEGYLSPDGLSEFDYVYQYKDHLGNIRLSYADVDNNGAISQSEIIEENNYYPFGLLHKGYNNVIISTNPAQDYKYNSKELQDELGLNWYDYGARNYDASLGRWMNLDPLADSYRSFTPYNYVVNNPILLIDPDGRDISFSFEYEKDKKGNEIVDKNGNRNLIGVTMTVTGKVINVSGKKVDVQNAISEISGTIKSSFNGKSSGGVKFNTVVNLTEAKSMDDIKESDHVFALANIDRDNETRIWGKDEYGNNKVKTAAGVNQSGGKVAFINVEYFRGIWNTFAIGGTEGERSAGHEFGHLLNLGHGSRSGLFNLMTQGGWGFNITKAQLSTIVKNAKKDESKINRGKNYEFVPVYSRKNGWSTKKMPNRGRMRSLIKY